MKIEIKTLAGSLLFEGDFSGLKAALVAAVNKNTYLRGADLRGADLQGADLQGADLQDANLQDANLQDADLQDADLQGANLRDADLQDADLRGVDLQGANLRGVDLRGVDLQGANLRGVDLGFTPDKTLPKKVASAIINGPDGPKVDMANWHKCETVHCIAGWAIHLSGPAGYALESIIGSENAGTLLMPSAAHMFHKTNDEALAWAKEQLK